MQQVGIAIREFAWEFERFAQDAGMTEEDMKVYLVSVLNQGSLTHLDTYVTMCGVDKMARLETIKDRLHHIPYIQIWVYLM